MEIQYDSDSDMLYVGLRSRPSVESEEVAPGIVFDFDESNNVVGIEITDGSKIADLTRLEVQGLATALLKQPAQ
ncbi:MAG: DUF2283 domain-containing protein [Chloroflexi bacterium]|nr:DUF2283 domain-containing protein [Chloroflexota bacterium]